MQNICYIEDVEQAMALLKPLRLEILRRLDSPRTCPELAVEFEESAQKIYYHVKALQEAGLVDKVAERQVRGTVEGYYEAKARSYWLAPKLVGAVGGPRQARDQASLRVLLQLAEDVIEDTGKLGSASESGQHVPSLSLSAQIHLADSAQRAEFLQELQTTFQALALKYGIAQSDDDADDSTSKSANFRLVMMCYPKQEINK
ncbi:MAG: helix-turn-helix domain-containing protein [Anaerolineae bacterium]